MGLLPGPCRFYTQSLAVIGETPMVLCMYCTSPPLSSNGVDQDTARSGATRMMLNSDVLCPSRSQTAFTGYYSDIGVVCSVRSVFHAAAQVSRAVNNSQLASTSHAQTTPGRGTDNNNIPTGHLQLDITDSTWGGYNGNLLFRCLTGGGPWCWTGRSPPSPGTVPAGQSLRGRWALSRRTVGDQ